MKESIGATVQGASPTSEARSLDLGQPLSDNISTPFGFHPGVNASDTDRIPQQIPPETAADIGFLMAFQTLNESDDFNWLFSDPMPRNIPDDFIEQQKPV